MTSRLVDTQRVLTWLPRDSSCLQVLCIGGGDFVSGTLGPGGSSPGKCGPGGPLTWASSAEWTMLGMEKILFSLSDW